jgi:hypothetical protein
MLLVGESFTLSVVKIWEKMNHSSKYFIEIAKVELADHFGDERRRSESLID